MNEAELLFTDVLKCSRQELYSNASALLDSSQAQLIAGVLKRRALGEPIQYILGKADFMGFELKVGPAVLIPRPETEILVETVLKYVPGINLQLSSLSILDIGTGSGNIAISLAKFVPLAHITAVDISEEALSIARENTLLNSVADKITFVCSDLFTNYQSLTTNHDIIVSNPPYIPSLDVQDLQAEVQHEPRRALDGGHEGLDFYKLIVEGSADFLKEQGFLVMEMGGGQCARIKGIFAKSGKFDIIDVVKDYNRIERVIVARKRI